MNGADATVVDNEDVQHDRQFNPTAKNHPEWIGDLMGSKQRARTSKENMVIFDDVITSNDVYSDNTAAKGKSSNMSKFANDTVQDSNYDTSQAFIMRGDPLDLTAGRASSGLNNTLKM